MTPATPSRTPEAARRKILQAAFGEFYHHGFQGGSLNHIVEVAGATALFSSFCRIVSLSLHETLPVDLMAYLRKCLGCGQAVG